MSPHHTPAPHVLFRQKVSTMPSPKAMVVLSRTDERPEVSRVRGGRLG